MLIKNLSVLLEFKRVTEVHLQNELDPRALLVVCRTVRSMRADLFSYKDIHVLFQTK
jgi:hypothetical protein